MNILLFFKKKIALSLVIVLAITGFSFLSYNNNYINILKSYEKDILSYINQHINTYQLKNANVAIVFKKINLSLDGLQITDIRFTKTDLQSAYIPILNIYLDWWSLLSLQIKFNATAPTVTTNLYLDYQIKKLQAKNLSLKTLEQQRSTFLTQMQNKIKTLAKNKKLLTVFNLPISNLNILNANISIFNNKTKKLLIKINRSTIIFKLTRQKANLDFSSSVIQLYNSPFKKAVLSLHNTLSIIKNKNIIIWAKIKYKKLFALLKIDKNTLDLQTKGPLKNILYFIESKKISSNLKHLKANIFLSVRSKSPHKKILLKFTLKQFSSYDFVIGDIKAEGSFNNNKLQVDAVSLHSKVWSAKSKAFAINLGTNPYALKFDANINKFYLKNLLPNNYIDLFADSLISCKGKIYPFNLNCFLSKTKVNKLKVRINNKEIFKSPLLFGATNITISNTALKFNSTFSKFATLKKNKITILGDFKYGSNFNINYKANIKKLASVEFFKKTLTADIKFLGSVHITPDKVINKNSIWLRKAKLNNILLGNLKFDSTYKDQQLFINNILLRNKREKLSGKLDFLFKQNAIFSNIQAQNITVSKINLFLKEEDKLRFTGSISKLSSKNLLNINFKLLSSEVKFKVNNLLINKFYFPEAHFYLKKKIANSFSYLKINTLQNTLSIYGTVFKDLSLNLKLIGTKLNTKNFIFFTNLAPLKSLFDIKSSIKGSLFNLDLKASVYFYQTYINNVLHKASAVKIKYKKNKLSVLSKLFNNKITADILLNLKNLSFYKLKIKINNWDYSPLLSFYYKTTKVLHSNLKANINIFKNKNLKYSGYLKVHSLFKNQKFLNFNNQKAIVIKIKDNLVSFKNFLLKGSFGYLAVKSKNTNSVTQASLVSQDANALNLQINSKFNLNLFNNFLSKTLIKSGSVVLNNLKITGPLNKPIFNGLVQVNNISTQNQGSVIPAIKNTSVKIHIVNSKAHLNTSKINLQDNASVKASGFFVLNKPFFIQLKGVVTNLNIDTQEGLKVLGSGDLKFFGQNKAYVLEAKYNIISGSFYKKILNWNTKNLDIDEKFLPKKQINTTASLFSPVLKIKLQALNPIKTQVLVGNITINTQVFGNLTINGPPSRALINGSIYSNMGEVLIQKQQILIDNIKIAYDKTLLNKSKISLLAHTQIQKIKIKIKARGPMDNIKFILSSEPPLPENKLAFLLVFGTLPDENTADWKEVSKSTSYSILFSFLKNYLKIKENLGLNLNLSSKAEAEGEAASSKNITLKNYTPVLNIEKKITTDLKIKASTDLNKGSKNTFLLQYQINPNLSINGSISKKSNTLSTVNENNKNVEFSIDYDREFE